MSDTALAEDAALAASSPSLPVREPLAGGHLVPVGDLLSETIAEFSENIGPYAMLGLAQMLITMPVTFVAIILVYALMFALMMVMMVGMVAAVAILGEDLGSLVAVLVQLLGIAGIFGLVAVLAVAIMVVMAPFGAGMARAVAAHQRGEGPPMTIGSPFTTITQDPGRVIPTAIAYATLITVGLVFCYLPALAVILFFGFANTLASLHRLSARDALSKSFAHARENIGWYIPFTAAWVGISMVAAYIPVIGPAFLVAFHVRAHRHLFGDGELPAA